MNQNREQLVAHQADVYVDVTPEQRGVLWDYVHRALCEAGLAEGAAEQLADRMLAALTVEDTATVERISRTYHRQPLSRRPDQQPIRTREDLADVVAHVAPGVAREQAEQVAERLMPRLTRRDALIRAQRTQIEELLAQLDRYRAAWRSARRRARQLRDDRDGTVWVHPHRQGGIACVGGTRVPVDNVVALLADGVPPEEIAACYPSVTADGARAAEAFAARYTDRHAPPTDAALADQLTEHREAIAYALRHTLTSWADATGRSEGTAAGTLHRALSWVTGHPTPPRDIPHEVTTLGLEVEDYRGATARVEAHLDHLTRRLEQLARRVDDLETTVNREDDQ